MRKKMISPPKHLPYCIGCIHDNKQQVRGNMYIYSKQLESRKCLHVTWQQCSPSAAEAVVVTYWCTASVKVMMLYWMCAWYSVQDHSLSCVIAASIVWAAVWRSVCASLLPFLALPKAGAELLDENCDNSRRGLAQSQSCCKGSYTLARFSANLASLCVTGLSVRALCTDCMFSSFNRHLSAT